MQAMGTGCIPAGRSAGGFFLAGNFLDAGSAIAESHKLSAKEEEISKRRARFDALSDEQKKVFARRMNEFNSKRS